MSNICPFLGTFARVNLGFGVFYEPETMFEDAISPKSCFTWNNSIWGSLEAFIGYLSSKIGRSGTSYISMPNHTVRDIRFFIDYFDIDLTRLIFKLRRSMKALRDPQMLHLHVKQLLGLIASLKINFLVFQKHQHLH